MARVKRSVSGKKHRRAVLESAKGYSGARSRHFRKANEQVMKSGQYAFRDRRARKGEFRRLWIVRINAACRLHDISYSRFISGLKAAEVEVDRKVLADIAVREPEVFASLVATAATPSKRPEHARPAPAGRTARPAPPRRPQAAHAAPRPRPRAEAGRFVAEGPRVVGAALDRRAPLDAIYVDAARAGAVAPLVARAEAAEVPVVPVAAGVLDRVADVRTPQPVLALAPIPPAVPGTAGRSLLVVATVSDPGNAGTLMRSAEAFGADAIAFGPGSVDAYNPKAVRASAGAVFGLPVVGVVGTEGDDDVDHLLANLGRQGVQRVGAAAHGGVAPEAVDLTRPTALVLGHEARGLPSEAAVLDALVTVPLHAPAESLNVAVAGAVLLAEAARQRRAPR